MNFYEFYKLLNEYGENLIQTLTSRGMETISTFYITKKEIERT